MAEVSNEEFDPFGLHASKGAAATAGKGKGGAGRAVLITITQGNAADHPTAQDAAGENGASFDPFGVAAEQTATKDAAAADARPESAEESLSLPPEVSRVTRQTTSPTAMGIPPKMMIKLSIHEEVSSVAIADAETEGCSDVSVEGSVYAQIQCSDAKRNAPFVVHAATNEPTLMLRPDLNVSKQSPKDVANNCVLVQVPKHDIGFVPVAHYTIQQRVQHMPLLLERKVTIHGTLCRIAIQVRSKLSNAGDMEEFTVGLAIPEHVDGDTVSIVRGEGAFDALKRIVKWKLPTLDRGESFMVSAQAELWKPLADDQDVRFPVLLRCTSAADQISAIDFQATQADGNPSSITASKSNAFRLLHRLP